MLLVHTGAAVCKQEDPNRININGDTDWRERNRLLKHTLYSFRWTHPSDFSVSSDGPVWTCPIDYTARLLSQRLTEVVSWIGPAHETRRSATQGVRKQTPRT